MEMAQPARILLALVAGLLLGIAGTRFSASLATGAVVFVEPIGTLWLNALRMTIIPLVIALLVTGVAASAEAARAGRLASRALVLFVAILWASSVLAAVLVPLFLHLFPLPAASAGALRQALSSVSDVGQVPGFGDFVRGIVPTNAVHAAANEDILPLIVFTLVFGFAVVQLPAQPRETLVAFFQAIGDAMLTVIGWVLWIGPLGVFALAYVVGVRAGGAAFGALLHYVIIVTAVGTVVWLAAWPLALVGARLSPGRFTRAILPSQVVAISTQSSLACLPAMLRGARVLGVPVATSGLVLPMAVAIFRATGPAMNLAVALYIAYWFGFHLTPAQFAAGIAAGAMTTMGAAGIPGQASFITSIAPICIAMGVPIEPLGLLIAVETLPDLMRTLGNVSMDVAATATVARRSGAELGATSEQDAIMDMQG
jgi:Na+/H+-dicarboxylate symporter